MAFGTGSRSFGPNSVLYSFKIKTKDLPSPVFEVSKKTGDGKYAVLYKRDQAGNVLKDKEDNPIPDYQTRVSGNLISASPKENTFEGKTIRSINLTLQDGNDVYFVSVGETFLGRNLQNALLALKTFDDIEIGLYQSRPKPGQTKTFASVSLRQHGESVRGRFDNKTELPATKKVRVNGKDQTDTEDLDNFFREKMVAWCKVVNTAAPKQVTAPTASESHAAPDDGHETHVDPTGEPETNEPLF